MSIEEIRARCGASITEMVSGPKEYGQSQQIIRDRAELIAAYDALAAELTALKRTWELAKVQLDRLIQFESNCTGRRGSQVRCDVASASETPVKCQHRFEKFSNGIVSCQHCGLPKSEFSKHENENT